MVTLKNFKRIYVINKEHFLKNMRNIDAAGSRRTFPSTRLELHPTMAGPSIEVQVEDWSWVE